MRIRDSMYLSFAAVLFTGASRWIRFLQISSTMRGEEYDDGPSVNKNLHQHSFSRNNATSWWRGQYDVSNETHPHLGAVHPEFQSLGWVINPTIERLRPPQYHLDQSFACPRAVNGSLTPFGIEGEGGHKVLTKVRGGLDQARRELSQSSKTTKILCMIYAASKSDGTHDNLAAVADTWGRGCDGFIGFSNLTDHSIGAINASHEGPELYGNSKCIANENQSIAQPFLI